MLDLPNTQYLIEPAVRILATGETEIKHRLLLAYTQKLQYVAPEHVPEELSALVLSIRERLFKPPTYKGQSVVESALYRMHRKTASAIATDILELHLALARKADFTE